ncbi:D-Ala-D-Ala dipeptidase VanX-P [Enterococcus faecium]|uniref:D-Ala-D-Ala dipeptidase VanX-P n=1 Tax=Enterococcus faecium TaxID=1352 RepID=UPI001CA3E4DD|nr:D-Ala-D-Ala dipeptidase VanX-P [Enterococcus faecium]MBY8625161.1 D-Ala-D-Ala dipeptidase VanX [Enterococcus faecium]MBY8628055.1 D-Ala-D-Ala dipeptidase VanX [Enterococcus faecium]MBY8634679.1 D-Ala-D-Ala dipeptidase VanX [Enterococcus faecium]MBY8651252.1 D-Ala-D-Ala dipeptidase VanX [Enterococcus faecium]
MKSEFVYLDEVIPGVRWDAKYATWDNFMGMPVNGYQVNRVVGTVEMADALKEVSKLAKEKGVGLLLWDGYRPVRAVSHFMEWVKKSKDESRKAKHYPHIDKKTMIEEGYIAEYSGHSRGSTIDLTLYDLESKKLLDMGGDFDLMDEISHYAAEGITKEEKENRKLLRDLMVKCGFVPYENEWWHYSLKDEPYPDTYFDFVIE